MLRLAASYSPQNKGQLKQATIWRTVPERTVVCAKYQGMHLRQIPGQPGGYSRAVITQCQPLILFSGCLHDSEEAAADLLVATP